MICLAKNKQNRHGYCSNLIFLLNDGNTIHTHLASSKSHVHIKSKMFVTEIQGFLSLVPMILFLQLLRG